MYLAWILLCIPNNVPVESACQIAVDVHLWERCYAEDSAEA